MAFTPRATFFFKNVRTEYGWSITLWPSFAKTYAQALASANTLAGYLVSMLAEGVINTEIRVSDDAVFRDSQISAGVAPNTNPLTQNPYYNFNALGTSPAPDNVALLLRLEGGPNYRGSLFLSGLPSTFTTAVNLSGRGDIWVNQAVANLATYLVQAGWAISVLPKGVDGPAPTAITNVVFNASNVPTITSPAHGLTSGTEVRVTGCKMTGGRFSLSNLPVSVIDVNNVTVFGFTKANHGTYVGGGQIAAIPRFIRVLSAVIPIGVTTHKRGRPFGQRHGKVRRH
jgi:hypothetical protein